MKMKYKRRVCPICGDVLFSNEKSFRDLPGYEGEDVCYPCYVSKDRDPEKYEKDKVRR